MVTNEVSVTFFSTVLNPNEDTTITVGNFATSNENSPFSPVVVPFVVPFSTTLIKASPSPSESTTLPFIVWAPIDSDPKNKNTTVKILKKSLCFI